MDTLPVTPSKILVSACLLGEPVRYDGRAQPLQDALLAQWRREGRVIPCCPELAGGLPVPRAPAERQADGRIVTRDGQDVSAAFARGAACALALCRQHGIRHRWYRECWPVRVPRDRRRDGGPDWLFRRLSIPDGIRSYRQPAELPVW